METFQPITPAEAAQHFADLLSRVYHGHEAFEIREGKTIMAQLVPVENRANAPQNGLLAWLRQPDRARLSAEDCDDYKALLQEIRAMPAQTRSWND